MAAINLFDTEEPQLGVFAQAAQEQPTDQLNQPKVSRLEVIDNVSQAEVEAATSPEAIQALLDRGLSPIRAATQVINEGMASPTSIANLVETFKKELLIKQSLETEQFAKATEQDLMIATANRKEAEELAFLQQSKDIEEKAAEKAEAAEEAAEEAELEREIFEDGPDFSFGADDAYEQYLENELWDEYYGDDVGFEEEQEPEMGMSKASARGADGDEVDADGDEIGTDGDEMGEDTELDEGTDIEGPGQELSALTDPEVDDPELEGEGKGAEGVEEGIEGEELEDMEVGELDRDDPEKSAPQLEAGKLEAPQVEAPIIEAPEVEAPTVSAASNKQTAEEIVDAEIGAALVSQVDAATGAGIRGAAVQEVGAKLSQDNSASNDAANQSNLKTNALESNAATEAVAAPEAPAKDDIAAAPTVSKGPALTTKPMDPWVEAISSKYAGLVDPNLFPNLAVHNSSKTGTVPPEHGNGIVVTASLPNQVGGAQQQVM